MAAYLITIESLHLIETMELPSIVIESTNMSDDETKINKKNEINVDEINLPCDNSLNQATSVIDESISSDTILVDPDHKDSTGEHLKDPDGGCELQNDRTPMEKKQTNLVFSVYEMNKNYSMTTTRFIRTLPEAS